MKLNIIFLATITICFNVSGQENNLQKELGLSFRNFDNFGIRYKVGTSTSLWNFSTLVLNGLSNKKTTPEMETTLNELGFTVEAGKEFRKPISSNLYMAIGVDLYFRYYQYSNKTKKVSQPNEPTEHTSTVLDPGLTCTLGFIYSFPNNLLFSASVNLFGIDYQKTKSETITVQEIRENENGEIIYGFQNIYANMTIAYRFY